MQRKIAVTLAAAGVVTMVGGAIAAVPSLAAPAAKAHTVSFTSKHVGAIYIKGSTVIVANNDFKGSKQVGADVANCTAAGTTLHCLDTLSMPGGNGYAKFTENSSTGALHGTVTGGTGKLKGAKGTIKGHQDSAGDEAITAHYKV